MSKTRHMLLPALLCTTIALFSGSVLAHEGPHALGYLPTVLHDLAYADYLPTICRQRWCCSQPQPLAP